MNIKILSFLLIILCSVSACKQEQQTTDKKVADNKLLMATLYNYYAAEYQALAHQAFNIGKKQLLIKRLHNPKAKNLAVVVDIDETILDNSPYEAKMILDDVGYNSETWIQWCNLASAKAVPGARGFLKFADSLDYRIFYLSNRKKETEQKSTMRNLILLEFPQITEKQFLLKVDESNKEARRNKILKKYNVVLYAGDNLGDFYEDSPDFKMRETLMNSHKSDFGEKFLVLPNAMYGEWVKSLEITEDPSRTRILLEKMIKGYEAKQNIIIE